MRILRGLRYDELELCEKHIGKHSRLIIGIQHPLFLLNYEKLSPWSIQKSIRIWMFKCAKFNSIVPRIFIRIFGVYFEVWR